MQKFLWDILITVSGSKELILYFPGTGKKPED